MSIIRSTTHMLKGWGIAPESPTGRQAPMSSCGGAAYLMPMILMSLSVPRNRGGEGGAWAPGLHRFREKPTPIEVPAASLATASHINFNNCAQLPAQKLVLAAGEVPQTLPATAE